MTVVQVGLISDTHMPKRWKSLPPAVFDVLAGVDLILHAGDVGQLWVLDELATIAPVIAVHGNDETPEAAAALPYLQTVALGGTRIVVTHAHYPDRAQELASRSEDWRPTLARRAQLAQTHGAQIIVFGHTHIPMNLTYDGVQLVNPGAIASGNPWTRQTLQSAARITLQSGVEPHIEHFDLSQPRTPFTPFFAMEAGFSGVAAHYSEPIVAPDFMRETHWLWEEVFSLAREPLEATLHAICHEVWAGERDILRPADLVERLQARDDIPAQVYSKLRESALFALHL